MDASELSVGLGTTKARLARQKRRAASSLGTLPFAFHLAFSGLEAAPCLLGLGGRRAAIDYCSITVLCTRSRAVEKMTTLSYDKRHLLQSQYRALVLRRLFFPRTVSREKLRKVAISGHDLNGATEHRDAVRTQHMGNTSARGTVETLSKLGS